MATGEVVTFPYKVVNDSFTIEGNPILFNCSQGFTQTLAYHSLPKY